MKMSPTLDVVCPLCQETVAVPISTTGEGYLTITFDRAYVRDHVAACAAHILAEVGSDTSDARDTIP